ncbi:MAG: ydaP, partial [Chloroflexi bacterium]|nr:ydaP [Chloroflexota bacterium]
MTASNAAQRTAAQALIDLLVDQWGMRHVFGLPGDAVNPLMEALRQRRDAVQFIQVRHEEAAALAAVGYAKFSGRLGVCLATSGPGAAHLINGLYDAKLDQVPVLAITGMPYHDLIGTNYQQDIDTDRLIADAACYSERIMGPAHLESVANLAVRTALATPGVAHLGFPVDFQEQPMASAKYSPMDQPHHTSAGWRPPQVVPTPEDLDRAADVLNAGSRIVMLIGSGARDARAEVTFVAELLGAPVAKALLGKDVMHDDHPYCVGGVGVIGTKAASDAMSGADTLLMIGTQFPYVSYLPDTQRVRCVQIDRNPTRIGLRYPAEVGLIGDAHQTLRALIPRLRRNDDRRFLQETQDTMREWREIMHRQETSSDAPMRPQVLAHELSRELADDAIICGDSGTVTVWASRNIQIRGEQRFSCSGLLASMGCALPYAIGAQVAFPDRQVVAFAGDGGITMLMGELATLVKYRLPVKVVISKNNVLGFVRWEQMLYAGNPEYGVELQSIDFEKVAVACGVAGYQVKHPDNLRDTISQAFANPGPSLIEAVTDPYEPVLPPSIRPDQAEHLAHALKSGEPNKRRIALTLMRDIVTDFGENVATLTEALEKEAPEVLEEGKKGAKDVRDYDPAAPFQEQ